MMRLADPWVLVLCFLVPLVVYLSKRLDRRTQASGYRAMYVKYLSIPKRN